MLIATYSIHDQQPRVMAHVTRPARWLVKLWAKSPDGNSTDTIRNRQPCMLSDIMALAGERSLDMMGEHEKYTDAGFTVIKLR